MLYFFSLILHCPKFFTICRCIPHLEHCTLHVCCNYGNIFSSAVNTDIVQGEQISVGHYFKAAMFEADEETWEERMDACGNLA